MNTIINLENMAPFYLCFHSLESALVLCPLEVKAAGSPHGVCKLWRGGYKFSQQVSLCSVHEVQLHPAEKLSPKMHGKSCLIPQCN